MYRRPRTRDVAAPTMEPMEPRLLLDGNPLITEFLADNKDGLHSRFGPAYDWIEVYNPTPEPISLLGWHLTDDPDDLDQWTFPDVTLEPGEYRVVFASTLNLIDPNDELHTNFSLSKNGDYVALVRPNAQQTDIVSEYTFGQQQEDVSYGLYTSTSVTTIVATGVPAWTLVPTGDLGLAWTAVGYDAGSWIHGTGKNTGVGYESTVVGFSSTRYKANIAVSSLAIAESVIATPAYQSGTSAANPTTINYMDNGGGGHYGSDVGFPGWIVGANQDNFVVEVNAIVHIPHAGEWTFGVNSNDGFGLNLTNGTSTFTMSYPGIRNAADTMGVFNVTTPGDYDLRLVYFENTSGAELELFAAEGTYTTWTSDFRLVGDTAGGGLAARADPVAGGGGTGSYTALIKTNIEAQMEGQNASAYVRVPFNVANPAAYTGLTLRMKYDDGFVVYLNGAEIARRNAPAGTPDWNDAATAAHATEKAVQFVDINISNHTLLAGANVLAIHALNVSAADGDLLVLPELANVQLVSTTEHFFSTPTPEQPNSAQFAAFVADTKFSVDRGFYDTPFTVAITCETAGASIYYTIDGSAPSATHGTKYVNPVAINTTTTLRAVGVRTGYESSEVDTQTYIFLNAVLTQTRPAGYPTTWGGGVAADYDMDPNVVNDPLYAATIKQDLLAVPSMSLVMDFADLFGPNGIYLNTWSEGTAWERAGSLEMILPDGSTAFQENAGIRIYGGVGRDPAVGKHSFRIAFKDIFGDTRLDYQLFEDSPIDSFDSIILRANFNDAWPGYWLGNRSQYIRDRWASETQLAMGDLSAHGNFVQLYINGMYWGLYNVNERPDDAFAASYQGGEKEEYDAINSYPQQPIGGDSTAWNAMMAIANAGVSSDAQYQALQQYIDVTNLANYVILNHYLSNWDWDDHNWYATRRREVGATWQFYSWDAEWVMYDEVLNSNYTGTNLSDRPSHVFQQLRANTEFLMLFADRVYKYCFNNGPLTPTAGAALWTDLATDIDRAIVGESARWGDHNREPAYTRDADWVTQQSWILNTWFPSRTNTLLAQYRSNGLYPTIDAPGFSKNGGPISAGYKLTMSGSASIYYTTDGSDPRLPGGAIASTAHLYTSSGVILNDSQVIKARVLSGTTWSALHEAPFYIDASLGVRVTEVMYNPAMPNVAELSLGYTNSDDFEYIELQNIGATTVNLFGLRFSDGITYDLPVRYLNAGQYALLVKNQGAFEARYGTGLSSLIVGEYTDGGQLNNDGERLLLDYALGGTVQDFTFKDGWYPQTDGEGFSLVIRDALADRSVWSTKDGWRASGHMNGSPGQADVGYTPGIVIVNEILTHQDTEVPGDWIELYNTTPDPVPIGGWFLSDNISELDRYQITPGAMLGGYQYLVLTEAGNFGVGAPDAGRRVGFALSELGETLYLSSAAPDGTVGGYREVQPFGAADRDVTFGLYTKSTGGTDFVAMQDATPWQSNSLPAVGPIVINEIMYNPAAGGDEFLELYNVSNAPVLLYDPDHPANTWQFTNGITFAFPQSASILAHGYALVVGIDPAVFRARYAIPGSVAIYGPYVGFLENAGETLELAKPGEPEPGTGFVPYIRAERVTYGSTLPWPRAADGTGYTLQRAVSGDYGNDVANWRVTPPLGGTPGQQNGEPPAAAHLTAVQLNTLHNRTVSDIEPSGTGVRTIRITFSEPVTFDSSVVVLRKMKFEGNTEIPGVLLTPASVTGSGTNVMLISFNNGAVVDTWVKVILLGDGSLCDIWGQALDGEPKATGTGRGYIYSAAADLPTGDGDAGGDAVFFVGSLRGDMRGVGFFGLKPDGIINVWDVNGFTSRFASGDLDADMRGVGFFQPYPDGLLNAWDINGFTSVTQAAIRNGTHLDVLPTLLGPLAAGGPAPLVVVLAEPMGAPVPAVVREPADGGDGTLSGAAAGGFDAGLTVSADETSASPAWSPTAPETASTDATLDGDGGLVDLLAQPALEVLGA